MCSQEGLLVRGRGSRPSGWRPGGHVGGAPFAEVDSSRPPSLAHLPPHLRWHPSLCPAKLSDVPFAPFFTPHRHPGPAFSLLRTPASQLPCSCSRLHLETLRTSVTSFELGSWGQNTPEGQCGEISRATQHGAWPWTGPPTTHPAWLLVILPCTRRVPCREAGGEAAPQSP